MEAKKIKIQIEFDNGKICESTSSYEAYEDVMKIHGHSILDDMVFELVKDANHPV